MFFRITKNGAFTQITPRNQSRRFGFGEAFQLTACGGEKNESCMVGMGTNEDYFSRLTLSNYEVKREQKPD